MKKVLQKPLYFTVLLATSFTACKSDSNVPQNSIDEEVFDPNSAINTVFDGKIFSIPSPIQTAYFIKEMDLQFDDALLNDDDNASEYVTEFKQSLNLGIYGADLAYASIYDQKGVSMRYLSVVEELTSQLGLSSSFDSDFVTRFEQNNNNEDSMIVLMSNAFSQADNFLKSSNRKSTSALVLTGGWIEMMHFASSLYEKESNEDILKRIGEQKQSLNSIIEILSTYNKGGENDELIDQLNSLKTSFDKVKLVYSYSAPETDTDKQLTTFHHTLNVEVSEEIVLEIGTKINEIRANIIKG